MANPHRRLLTAALVLLCLAALQWPFLQADADPGLGWSRGPYTDEALYTVQARNALVTGRLDLGETDGFIKEPLFAAGTWAVQAGIGESMGTVRAAVMLACAAVLAWLASAPGSAGRMVRLAVPAAFLSYLPFHYGHLAMAELPCSVALLVAVVLLQRRLSGGHVGWLVGASAAVVVAYALKIQFVYAAVIPPLACLLSLVLRKLGGLPLRRRDVADVLLAAALAGVGAALFAAAWVLPQHALFMSILGAQAAERTAGAAQIPHLVIDNLREVLRQRGAWPLLLFAALGAVCAVRAWRGGPVWRTAWISLLAPSLAWLAIESHKLLLPYLPSRYYVSSLLALAVVGSAGIAALGPWRSWPTTPLRRAAPALLALVVALNLAFYVRSLGQRQYALHDTQQALIAEGHWRGKTVVGPWAPALFWGTGAVAKPVWHNAFNDRDIVATLAPAAIVSEPDQQDSHRAFALDGVTLPRTPDRRVTVHGFEVDVYHWPQRPPAAPVAVLEVAPAAPRP